MELERALHFEDVVATIKITSRTGKGHSLLTNRRPLFMQILEDAADDLNENLKAVVPLTPGHTP